MALEAPGRRFFRNRGMSFRRKVACVIITLLHGHQTICFAHLHFFFSDQQILRLDFPEHNIKFLKEQE
jgi:hypothetical protein